MLKPPRARETVLRGVAWRGRPRNASPAPEGGSRSLRSHSKLGSRWRRCPRSSTASATSLLKLARSCRTSLLAPATADGPVVRRRLLSTSCSTTSTAPGRPRSSEGLRPLRKRRASRSRSRPCQRGTSVESGSTTSRRRGTRGIILLLSQLTARQRGELDARGLPFVVIDPTAEPGPEVSSVGATNWSGGLAATKHLVDLGHRRIGIITGPPELLSSRARLDGYRGALERAGLSVDTELVRQGDFRVRAGYEQAKVLFGLSSRPTAIFAGNDLSALGVLRAAREAGLHVPEDLSVVGFDDIPLSEWSTPALTTVRQPLTEMARVAVQILLESAESAEPVKRRVELATDLIVRESTAPPGGHDPEVLSKLQVGHV